MKNTCTDEEIQELTVKIDKIYELYENISYNMSTTYLLLLFIFECFLLFRKGRTIYVTTLILFFGYCYFLCTLFYQLAEAEIN